VQQPTSFSRFFSAPSKGTFNIEEIALFKEKLLELLFVQCFRVKRRFTTTNEARFPRMPLHH
jgi:hypothetical protein